MRPLIMLGLLALVPAVAAATPPPHDDIAGKPSLTANAADLRQTEVVADLEHAMTEGKSVLWCSTLKLAWDELAQVMGPPIKPGPGVKPAAAEMIGALNSSQAGKGDLDAASYVAMAGFGRDDILAKIKAALQDRFHGAASPKLLPSRVESDEIFAYAYLFKNLEFAEPFIRRPSPLEFGGAKVAAFGLWPDDRLEKWGEIAKQVLITSYEAPDKWTVELKSKAADDRLIIARLPKEKTLAATVEAALRSGKDTKPASMAHEDTLIVPLLNFDITRDFHELVGATLAGTKTAGPVLDAVQNIRFRLDERGAVLKSEAGLRTGAAVRPTPPRRMVCDGPFLIVMTRADAQRPYFAAWVENPEVLAKAAKK